MDKTNLSYKLSELPDNLMISPKFLFDWWDLVIGHFGSERALNDKSADFRLARELRVSAVFACCKRLSSNKEHWVAAVSDQAPDALVARFDLNHIGAFRQIYPIEVTEYGSNSASIEEVIKKKLDKAYTQVTRIVCYISRSDMTSFVDTVKLSEFVSKNNPSGYEVWVLGSFQPQKDTAVNPLKLFCLTASEDYQIDLAEEKLVANTAQAVLVPDHKAINKDGKLSLIGIMTLEFPSS